MKANENQPFKRSFKKLLLVAITPFCWSSPTLPGEEMQLIAMRTAESHAHDVARLYAGQDGFSTPTRQARGVASMLDGGRQDEAHDGLVGRDPWEGPYAFRISPRESGGFRVEIRSAGPNKVWEKEPSDDLTMTFSF